MDMRKERLKMRFLAATTITLGALMFFGAKYHLLTLFTGNQKLQSAFGLCLLLIGLFAAAGNAFYSRYFPLDKYGRPHHINSSYWQQSDTDTQKKKR